MVLCDGARLQLWSFDTSAIADTKIYTTDDNGDDAGEIVSFITTHISLLIEQTDQDHKTEVTDDNLERKERTDGY